MLLGRSNDLAELGNSVLAFASSPKTNAEFPAETIGDPTPYNEFLVGLRIAKREGKGSLALTHDSWLELAAPLEDLRAFSRKFQGLQDGDHHHWYASPVSLIIEADDAWPD